MYSRECEKQNKVIYKRSIYLEFQWTAATAMLLFHCENLIRKTHAGDRGKASTPAKHSHRPAKDNFEYGYSKILRLT